MLPSQLVFPPHAHFYVPSQSALEVVEILAEKLLLFFWHFILKIVHLPSFDLELLNQRKIFFITMLQFEIPQTKFKGRSLPKEADNVAIYFVQRLKERCRTLPVCGRSLIRVLTSQLKRAVLSPTCVPLLGAWLLCFGSGGHPLRTWMLPQELWRIIYLHVICISSLLGILWYTFVLIGNIASLVSQLGEAREESIGQCHGREMRAVAGGAARMEPAVPCGRQRALDEFSSIVQGGKSLAPVQDEGMSPPSPAVPCPAPLEHRA